MEFWCGERRFLRNAVYTEKNAGWGDCPEDYTGTQTMYLVGVPVCFFVGGRAEKRRREERTTVKGCWGLHRYRSFQGWPDCWGRRCEGRPGWQ